MFQMTDDSGDQLVGRCNSEAADPEEIVDSFGSGDEKLYLVKW